MESRRQWIHLCSVPVSRLHAGDNNLIFWLSPDVLCGSKQIADHTHDLAELYSNIWPTCYPNMLLSFQHTLSCLGRLYCTFSEFTSCQTKLRERERERESFHTYIQTTNITYISYYSLYLGVAKCGKMQLQMSSERYTAPHFQRRRVEYLWGRHNPYWSVQSCYLSWSNLKGLDNLNHHPGPLQTTHTERVLLQNWNIFWQKSWL